jgi:hypothetical protein
MPTSIEGEDSGAGIHAPLSKAKSVHKILSGVWDDGDNANATEEERVMSAWGLGCVKTLG